jgi:hypothetical protein
MSSTARTATEAMIRDAVTLYFATVIAVAPSPAAATATNNGHRVFLDASPCDDAL